MPTHQLLRPVKAKSLRVKISRNDPNTARVNWQLADGEFLTVEIPRYVLERFMVQAKLPPLSTESLALILCLPSPQLSQLRFAAVEFVSITPPDSLNRVRLGPESAACILPHPPSLPVPCTDWARTLYREPQPATRPDRLGA